MKKFFFFLLVASTAFSCKKECEDEDQSCKADLSRGLLAYYPFNGNFNDASGNGNHGSPKNGATLGSDFIGRSNSAATFDGWDDYIIVPGSSKLDADSFTLSFQVLVNNANRRNVTVSRISYLTGESLIFGVHESQPLDNKYSFGVTPGTDDCSKEYPYDPGLATYAKGPIEPGRWYNITATFGNGIQQIFVDDVLENSKTRSFTNAKKCASADLMIGGWWSADIVSIDGKIDEVRLYNRVLNTCEIKKLAQAFQTDSTGH